MAKPTSGLLKAQRRVFSSTAKPLERLVALALLDHWSAKSMVVFPSFDRLESWTGLCRHAIDSALRGLEAAGLVRVERKRGCPSRYNLAPLFAKQTSDETSAPDALVTSAPDALLQTKQAVHQTHHSSAPDALLPVHQTHSKEPKKEPKKGSTTSPLAKSGKSPHPNAHALKVHYIETFRATRGTEPVFAESQWSRAMKALGQLSDAAGGLEKAKGVITNALQKGIYCSRIQPWELALDANKHLGAPPTGGRQVRPQSGGIEFEVGEFGGVVVSP